MLQITLSSVYRAGTWFPSGIALHFSLLFLNFPPHLAHIGLTLVTATVTELFCCGVPSKVHPALGSGGSSLGRSKRFSIVLLGRTTCVWGQRLQPLPSFRLLCGVCKTCLDSTKRLPVWCSSVNQLVWVFPWTLSLCEVFNCLLLLSSGSITTMP